MSADLAPFRRPDAIIDADHPEVAALAARLARGSFDATAQACFEWVRDEVPHTVDVGGGPLTCRASDVLAARTGFCYAKSHLLAALLRANGMAAGLCYQRLRMDDGTFALHGLVAVLREGAGWYRCDPRGGPVGQAARYAPPQEHFVYVPAEPGEADLPGVYATPPAVLADALTRPWTWRDLMDNLPDLPPLPPPPAAR